MEYVEKYEQKNIQLKHENMYVVMDFDGTITKYTKVDSWDVAGQGLGEDFKVELARLFNKYRPIELDYKISYEDKCKAMEDWYKQCINLYYKYNLTKNNLDKAIENCGIEFRDGIKTFFEYMNTKNVPVIILSAGIGNVIEGVLKNNNCYYENMYIISNFINFDEKGNIHKFNGEIINSTNKRLDKIQLGIWGKKLENRKYKLLLGDLIEDKNMLKSEEWDTTVTVGFIEKALENLPKFQDAFDIVLTNEDANYNKVMKILNFN